MRESLHIANPLKESPYVNYDRERYPLKVDIEKGGGRRIYGLAAGQMGQLELIITAQSVRIRNRYRARCYFFEADTWRSILNSST